MYRKLMTFAAATVLTAGLAFAQDTTSTTQGTSQQQQTSVGQPTDMNEPLFKGCVSGTKDNYVLTTEDGKSYRLHSDKDINEHVGKFVEVRGSVKKETVDRPADAQTGGTKFSEMDVADMKNVDGKSCPATTSDASAMKSGEEKAAVTEEAPATEGQSKDAAAKPESDASATPKVEEPAKTDNTATNGNFYGNENKATTTTTDAASTDAAKVEDKPVAENSAVATDSTAVATEEKKEEVKPEANAAVSTDNSTVAQNDQAATSTEAPKADNAVASDASAQNNASDASALPQTASPLPLLGLLGFASTGIGFLARRRK